MRHRVFKCMLIVAVAFVGWISDSPCYSQAKKPARVNWKVRSNQVFREYDLPEPTGKGVTERTVRKGDPPTKSENAILYGNLLLLPGKPIQFASSRGGLVSKVEASENSVIEQRQAIKADVKAQAPWKYLVTEITFSSSIGTKTLGAAEYLLRFELFDLAGKSLGNPVAYYQRGRTVRYLVFEGDFANANVMPFNLQDTEGDRAEFIVK